MSESDDKTGRAGAKAAIAFAEKSDVGTTREENQDALGHATFGRHRLWVVCDGMGGHAGGSTASRLAVETILDSFGAGAEDDPPNERLVRAIQAANKKVFQAARADRSLKGMGTTAVALLFDTEAGESRVAHVGDSRAYLARGSTFRRLTRDHTMVQQMVDDGILTDQQAEGHPHGNVISRSLGGGRSVDVECLGEPLALEPGDLFVLCTDGLTGPVPEPEIAELLWRNKPKAAAAALVAQANASGGEDNVSVQIVRYGPPPEVPETIEIVHPEGRPSGLLEELARRTAGQHGVASTRGDEQDEEDLEEQGPSWPSGEASPADLRASILPAALLGFFLGMVAFLAVYLSIDRAAPPPTSHEGVHQEQQAPDEAAAPQNDEAPP